jgi:hypothetical protein
LLSSSIGKTKSHGQEQQQQQQEQDQIKRRSLFLDRKIDDTAAGLPASYSRLLYSIPVENTVHIIQYILSMKTEVNLSDHYRKDLIVVLTRFSKYNNNKSFKDIIRNDIVAFLESFRKPETADPLHKWIGTYNIYRMHLLKFFKWLYYPDIEPKKRPKPDIVDNIPQLKRKEQSIYKPSDLWTIEDDLLFIKYCPNKRDRCYHTISSEIDVIIQYPEIYLVGHMRL